MAKVDLGPWHWRNTMKTVRFFTFDARAGLCLFAFLMHMRLYMLYFLFGILMVFYLLERKGLSFPAAIRAARVWIIGPYRPAWIWTRRRRLTDTGSR